MRLFNNNELTAAIHTRSLSLLIGKDFADKLSGKMSLNGPQDSEQVNRRRELLAVEEETNKNRIIEAHGKNHYKNQVMEKFLIKLDENISLQFDNKDNLYNKTLNINNAIPDILEILCLKAASIKRIAPLINLLPWLATDLVNLVNKPQYRKRADVQVTDPNLAISYVGLDNLKQVMPTFIFKNLLPNTTGPFKLLKRKLWNDSLSIALASALLAEEAGLDTFTAFTAGMFSNIGRLVVTRCHLQTYSDLHRRELEKAYDHKDKKKHEALVELESSPELLLEQLTSHSEQITADIIELMNFERLQITEAIFDLANATDFEKMCPIAKVVAKAKTYVTFRGLAKEELISSEETKTLFTSVKITPKCIALLKKSDIDHIKLKFN